MARDVVLVLDRSGSMAGVKMAIYSGLILKLDATDDEMREKAEGVVDAVLTALT